MIEELKTRFYTALKEAGLNITDNANYEQNFPWCMLRISNIQRVKYHGARTAIVSFAIDVFSTYSGEKEILELESKITDIAESLEWNRIMGTVLNQCRILDDKTNGPVKKHGVLTYKFIIAEAWEDGE